MGDTFVINTGYIWSNIPIVNNFASDDKDKISISNNSTSMAVDTVATSEAAAVVVVQSSA